jgi:hypothetical protein
VIFFVNFFKIRHLQNTSKTLMILGIATSQKNGKLVELAKYVTRIFQSHKEYRELTLFY